LYIEALKGGKLFSEEQVSPPFLAPFASTQHAGMGFAPIPLFVGAPGLAPDTGRMILLSNKLDSLPDVLLK